MNKRLEAIARLVMDGRGLADVGTDHGYLPIWLAQHGYGGKLFASDVNPLPLSAAIRSAQEAGLEKRIHFALSDGLEQTPPDEIDTIVIAGMGGDLICDILDRAEWCMDPRYSLLLQPMTKAEVLRYWLCNNGFVLTEEKLVRDGAFLYQVISARFQENMKLSDAELFSGAFTNLQRDPLAGEWLELLCARFDKELSGLSAAAKQMPEKIELCREILRELAEMKGHLP